MRFYDTAASQFPLLAKPSGTRAPNFVKWRPGYTLNEDPHPQVLFTLGFSNLKPAPSSVST
jgi:hypothetical protein